MRYIFKSKAVGVSWNDPGQLSIIVASALVYFASLVAFERYTSYLDDFQEPYFEHARLPRSLLSIESKSLNQTNLTKSPTSTNVEEEGQDPLFPKDVFSIQQIRQGKLQLTCWQHLALESRNLFYLGMVLE